MPRRPRVMLANVPVHIIQRGNNRQICFAAEGDFRCYLKWLKQYAEETACHIHAFVLMTNHVHLLLTADRLNGAAELMKKLGQRYAQYFNRQYQRSGSLWEGRFRSSLIQDEVYLFSCMRYIELNPLRAGIVAQPDEYPWSSFRANAQGEASELVSPHFLYEQLAQDASGRQSAYRELFRYSLEPEVVEQIRRSANGNIVLGHPLFAEEIAKTLGVRVTHGRPGRPKKAEEN